MEQLSFLDLVDSSELWISKANAAIEKYEKSASFPNNSISLRENVSKKDTSIITSYSVVIGKADYPKGVNSNGKICSSLFNVEEDGKITKGTKTKNGDIIIKTTSIGMASSIVNDFTHLEVKTRPSDNYYRIPVRTSDEHFEDIFFKLIGYALTRYFSSGTDSFGCCHLYKECSNAKKCLHENQLYARGCTYYYNLNNGRIFYGENAMNK